MQCRGKNTINPDAPQIIIRHNLPRCFTFIHKRLLHSLIPTTCVRKKVIH